VESVFLQAEHMAIIKKRKSSTGDGGGGGGEDQDQDQDQDGSISWSDYRSSMIFTQCVSDLIL
jgi:hypothetical protein